MCQGMLILRRDTLVPQIECKRELQHLQLQFQSKTQYLFLPFFIFIFPFRNAVSNFLFLCFFFSLHSTQQQQKKCVKESKCMGKDPKSKTQSMPINHITSPLSITLFGSTSPIIRFTRKDFSTEGS